MPAPLLFLIHSLGQGGGERQLCQTALALDRDRFAPHVASVLGGFHEERLTQAGVPVWRLPLKSLTGWSAVRSARLLRQYVRRHGIRLVHTFDYTLTVFGIPVIRTCPGTVALAGQRCFLELVPSKYRLPLRLSLRLAHGIAVNSYALREHLAGDYGFPTGRIHVCHNGIDTEAFRPQPKQRLPELEQAGLVLGTVCVLRPEKNLGVLLQAFARLRARHPSLRLLIAGGGPESESLQRQCRQLGIQNHCLFRPSSQQVAPYLRSIDVFVHPAISEGLPNSVMEAMAAGCCVVASDAEGCSELITHRITGLLFRNNDLQDLERQLQTVIEDEPLRLSLAKAAAERIPEEFSMQQSARCLEKIYEGFLARHRA